MGKFVMKETKNGGVKFDLKAGNGEVIATSEAYSGDAACKKGIESVRKNAVEAKLEDQTVEGFETVTNPKFEVTPIKPVSSASASRPAMARSSPPPRATRPRPAASMALRASARMPLTPPL